MDLQLNVGHIIRQPFRRSTKQDQIQINNRYGSKLKPKWKCTGGLRIKHEILSSNICHPGA
jgi:hypothetical protein